MHDFDYPETRKLLAEHMVVVLNQIVSLDQDAISALVANRLPCNESLARHPTVQVMGADDDGNLSNCSVGLLGILNGLVGVDKSGRGIMSALIDEGTGKVTEFTVIKSRELE